ncbi:TSUP family transporter [Jannaschia sp. Os4]|uniref:TSUP family transporter n=1 Tax=Jannaschia sp. Os4 TaxID=2807617 RepID=UPI00193993C7|nr:TSUP family transporter [Jannaschia sp. Os4]MBM2576183.1 TSUP family transporter [Jannaschia sp. Os4]
MIPDPLAWLACAAAVAVGCALQRLSGAGFGMMASPVMVLVAPEWMPATVLLLGVAVGIGSAAQGWDAVARGDLPPGMAGRTLGAGVAAVVATAVVGTEALPLVVGIVVLLGVALSVAGLRVPITGATLFGAGTTAGVMGTLTGIGAPPMALLYADVEARRAAATQNAFFGFGMIVSLAALAAAGLIGLRHLAFAASLAPLVPLTLWASRPFAARVEKGAIRPWALGLATLAATVLIVRTLA